MKDAIIILAGGINRDGSLPDIPKRRVEEGVRLWKERLSEKIIMTGNYDFWLDQTKQIPSRSEAEAMQEYAESLGVPSGAVVIEKVSKDTVGNAYFTKIDVLEKNGWKNVIVVTSAFHMLRARFIFDFVLGSEYQIEYVPVQDNFTPEEKIKRETTEKRTIEVLKQILGDVQAGDTVKIKEILFKKHPGYAKNSEISFDQLKQMLDRSARE